jgi:hypothetical protein
MVCLLLSRLALPKCGAMAVRARRIYYLHVELEETVMQFILVRTVTQGLLERRDGLPGVVFERPSFTQVSVCPASVPRDYRGARYTARIFSGGTSG